MRTFSSLKDVASYASVVVVLFGCQASIAPPTDVPEGASVKGFDAPPTKGTGATRGKPTLAATPSTAPPRAVGAGASSASARALTVDPDPSAAPVSAAAKEPPKRSDVDLKGMTKDEARGWREGRAMTLARVAEKNHYPAPYFALKMVSELALFEDQIAPIRAIYDGLRRRSLQLGRQLIDEETKLEIYFEDQEKDPPKLEAIVRESARLRGEIRLVHLQADIETRKILNADQLVKYEAIRGVDPNEDGK